MEDEPEAVDAEEEEGPIASEGGRSGLDLDLEGMSRAPAGRMLRVMRGLVAKETDKRWSPDDARRVI